MARSGDETVEAGVETSRRRVSLGIALEGDRSHQDITKLAKLAEKLGFDSVHLYEHLPHRPAWASAFLIARETIRVTVGPVTVPALAYDPLVLARFAAALKEVAGERALLGISRGAFGELIGRTRPRVEELAAYLKELHGLLRGNSSSPTVDWAIGKLPKIYVGTSGKRLGAIAAAMPFVAGVVVDNLWDPSYARLMASNAREVRESTTMDPEGFELIARPFCYVSDDRRAALSTLVPALKTYLVQLVGNSPMLRHMGLDLESLEEILEGPLDRAEEVVRKFAFFGTVSELEDHLVEMFKSGVTQVCFGYPLGPSPEEAIRSIARALPPPDVL
ncbi:MAG: LLM class flavin-dependent oxidoreductase [Thaumarchaeota archaeon]|nr:LLM class flavin-dependent oxidoreductase [Candidatus Calditenuaceae archaeon]MDW8041716.1 LLM class flavin-dependent oxidoreductase [Nitrososphaerota archaeon]